MLVQILWVASWPIFIWASYRIIVLAINKLDKKESL
jgi:hypothetical protein